MRGPLSSHDSAPIHTKSFTAVIFVTSKRFRTQRCLERRVRADVSHETFVRAATSRRRAAPFLRAGSRLRTKGRVPRRLAMRAACGRRDAGRYAPRRRHDPQRHRAPKTGPDHASFQEQGRSRTRAPPKPLPPPRAARRTPSPPPPLAPRPEAGLVPAPRVASLPSCTPPHPPRPAPTPSCAPQPLFRLLLIILVL